MITLAIDPGTNYGWAVFDCDRLVDSGAGKFSDDFLVIGWAPGRIVRIVCEYPVVYPGCRPGKANSELKLAFIAGRLVEGWRRVADAKVKIDLVKPSQWKGSVPKKIHQKRILSTITAPEKQTLAGKVTSDQIDAIGIGLWAVGRLKK